MFIECICDKDTLGKFLVRFYDQLKRGYFQNCFANKLKRWFVFEAVQNIVARVF